MERLTAGELEIILKNCETPPKYSEFVNRVASPNPFFTGWKGFFKGIPSLQSVLDTEVFEVEDKAPVFVGQWVFWNQHLRKGVYVNLPSLSGGEFMQGQSFNIGDVYLSASCSEEESERLIESGYQKLIELAKEAGITKA